MGGLKLVPRLESNWRWLALPYPTLPYPTLPRPDYPDTDLPMRYLRPGYRPGYLLRLSLQRRPSDRATTMPGVRS